MKNVHQKQATKTGNRIHCWYIYILQPVNVRDAKYAVVENGNLRQLQVMNVSAADEAMYSCRVQSKQSMAKLLVARTCFYTHYSNS